MLGIEPASNVAAVAREAGVPTIDEFFGVALAQRVRAEFGAAHLIVANNVLAHVPDLNDFVGGFAALLARDGVATIEFPHLLRTMAGMQFDTVYHEHFSYLSLIALTPLFARHGLEIVEVTELPTHGGSLRVFVAPRGSRARRRERRRGARRRARGRPRTTSTTYAAFGARVAQIKDDFVAFLLDAKRRGKRVARLRRRGEGDHAAELRRRARRPDAVRRRQEPAQAGQRDPRRARADRRARPHPRRPADYVVIFPWNVEAEIRAELADVRDWGGRFVLAIPELRVDA